MQAGLRREGFEGEDVGMGRDEGVDFCSIGERFESYGV